MARVSDAQLSNALVLKGGIMSEAGKACGISRQAVYDRVQNTPALRETIRLVGEQLLDIAESQLTKSLKRGDKEMVRYYLDRKGKKRGYGNSVNVGIDDAQAEAIVRGLGGSVEAFRAALRQLGVPASEIP